MFVYNITIKINAVIEREWIEWQKNEHIPDVMSTGLFHDYKFFRLLEQDETDGITYIVQYLASSLENYKNYIEKFAPVLREKAVAKWGNQFIAFRTIMEAVN
jgi:SNF2 family DNA or RNA helicase